MLFKVFVKCLYIAGWSSSPVSFKVDNLLMINVWCFTSKIVTCLNKMFVRIRCYFGSSVSCCVLALQGVDKVSSQMLQAQAAITQFNEVYEDLDQAASTVNDSFAHADNLQEQATLLEK